MIEPKASGRQVRMGLTWFLSCVMSHFVITPTVLLSAESCVDAMSKAAWLARSFVPLATQL